MTQRKFGRFELPQDFMRKLHEGEGVNLFHGMFILRATEKFERDVVEYIGIHEDFDYCPIGQIVPLYVAHFNTIDTKPKWERVE